MKNFIAFILSIVFVSVSINAGAQLIVKGNQPYKKTAGTPIESGPDVIGGFEGRTPCKEVLEALNMPPVPACLKMKWSLTLYQDPVSRQPTRFTLRGTYSNHTSKEGKLNISKGMPGNPDAIIYELSMPNPESTLYMLKGGEHILFILDKNKNFLKGNSEFSYSLNRVVN